MSIRRILVPFFGYPPKSWGMEMAMLLAKDFNARVTVLHTRSKVDFHGLFLTKPRNLEVSGALGKYLSKQAAERENEFRLMFEKISEKHKVSHAKFPNAAPSASFHISDVPEAEAIKSYGRVHDIVVVGCYSNHLATHYEKFTSWSLNEFGNILCAIGHPLLLAPRSPPSTVGTKILIGWNDSAESARAVTSAIPFLKRAKSVIAISITTDAGKRSSIDNLVRYLHAHDIETKSKEVEKGQISFGQILLDEAKHSQADLLVVGGILILGSANRLSVASLTICLCMPIVP